MSKIAFLRQLLGGFQKGGWRAILPFAQRDNDSYP